MGGQGSLLWLAGFIEKSCAELDQVECDMRGCRAFQNEVDFRASQSRRAIEAYSRVIHISLVVIYSEHVGGNGLLTFGPKSEGRHRVAMPTNCEVGSLYNTL